MSNAYRSSKGAQAILPTGDAVEANVLAGKTFSNALGTGKTGTMTNNGAVTQTLQGGQTYTIPEGYHSGTGTVTATAGNLVLDSIINEQIPYTSPSVNLTLEVGKTYILTVAAITDATLGSATVTITGATYSNHINAAKSHSFLIVPTSTTVGVSLSAGISATAIAIKYNVA